MGSMSDTDKKTDQEKGDEVLRRLLKAPPDPKTGKGAPRNGSDKKAHAATSGRDHGDQKT